MNPHHRWTPALLGLLLLGASCGAREVPWAAAESELEDLRLAVKARTLLHRDPALGPMNLGVDVRRGVATLWGPVPSEAHLRHAVEILRGSPGIREVRADVYLASRDGFSGGRLTLPEDLTPTTSASAVPDRVHGRLPAWTGVRLLPSVAVAREEDPAGFRTLDLRKGAASGSPVALLAPIPVPDQLPGSGSTARPTGDTLLAALADLHRSNPRYQRIHIEVREGVVSLRSRGTADGLVMAFARKARTLPGVRRVVIRQDDGR
jgi:hypothetical protein